MPECRTALITGAARGLGSAFANALATVGYDLILTDRTAGPLSQLAKQIEADHRVGTDIHIVDLTDRTDLRNLASTITATSNLGIVVNNAGFGNPGFFPETDLKRTIDMIDVHVVASTWLCRAALPQMIARGKGSIINISSLGGFRAGTGDVVYSSSKRYLIHFSKCLQAELTGHGVKVQALCPGFTRSGFHSTADYRSLTRGVPDFLWMDPEDVVTRSLAALGGNRVVCIPGIKNQALRLLMHFPLVIRALQAAARRLF